VTPPGIDPGTVRLVAQRLNHYATPSPCMCQFTRNIKQLTGSEHTVTVPTSGLSFNYTSSNRNIIVRIMNAVIGWHLFNCIGYKTSSDYKWKIGKGVKVTDVVMYVGIMYCHSICWKRLGTSIENLVIMKALLWNWDPNKQLSVSHSTMIFGGN
jgi:hypothetical protein